MNTIVNLNSKALMLFLLYRTQSLLAAPASTC